MELRKIIIIKTDGASTYPAMAQAQGQTYLLNVMHEKGFQRDANLKQSLNQAMDGNGKSTGSFTYLGNPVLHASSGNGQESVTIFYYTQGDVMHVFAMGEHKDSKGSKTNGYEITIYGQASGDFRFGAKISLP